MTRLSDLHPKKRAERIELAVNGVLRQIGEPVPSSDLIQRVCAFLGVDKAEQNLVARYCIDLAKRHPLAQQTGETFVKYGKLMRRWEWLPSHSRLHGAASPASVPPAEPEADEWTVQPGEFLEDQ